MDHMSKLRGRAVAAVAPRGMPPPLFAAAGRRLRRTSPQDSFAGLRRRRSSPAPVFAAAAALVAAPRPMC